MTNSEPMSLVIAVVRDSDSDAIIKALVEADFRVTRIASTGGFLRHGNSTLLIGVNSDRVKEVFQIIREHSTPSVDFGLMRGMAFALKVERFEQV
ncbi:MAG: hypothetical protein D6770_04200 [Anaerolineae bacterium]|nr:MAG: hypothetical protein D6770_04200 [Anaerolineae bacterium]